MAQVMARPVDDPQVGLTVRVSNSAGIQHGHHLVIAAMDQQQLARGQNNRSLAGINGTQLLRPITEVLRKVAVADRSHLACEYKQLTGTAGPVAEIGR